MASSSFFTDFLYVSLYTFERPSLSAVCLVVLGRLGHPVINRLQIGNVLKHFLDPVQFPDIDNRRYRATFFMGYKSIYFYVVLLLHPCKRDSPP